MLLTILIVLCVLFLLLGFLLIPGESKMDQRAPFWGVNHAHRGLYEPDQSIPENSLAAFVAAVDKGYGIELDLQLSKDGQVVVFHDDDLMRICGEPGAVADYTLEQLQRFHLFETTQHIPTLPQVLAVVNSTVPLIIELKSSSRNRELCEAAWKILRQYDGDFCIESFDPRILRWFKKNVPGILRGQLSAPPRELGKGLLGFGGGHLLSNFIGRPQFIAYKAGPKPLLVGVAEKFAMRVSWTVRPGYDIEDIQQESDAVIFEFYEPEPRYKWSDESEIKPTLPRDADLPDAGDTYYDEPEIDEPGPEEEAEEALSDDSTSKTP